MLFQFHLSSLLDVFAFKISITFLCLKKSLIIFIIDFLNSLLMFSLYFFCICAYWLIFLMVVGHIFHASPHVQWFLMEAGHCDITLLQVYLSLSFYLDIKWQRENICKYIKQKIYLYTILAYTILLNNIIYINIIYYIYVFC